MYGDFLTLIWKNLLIQFNIKLMCFIRTKQSKVSIAKRDIKFIKIVAVKPCWRMEDVAQYNLDGRKYTGTDTMYNLEMVD